MNDNTVRAGLPELPARMRKLPVDARGYPVPWFVSWIDGKPEFRAVDGEKLLRAYRFRLCWVCGEQVGRHMTFVIGPMCMVNRTSAEAPCHLECAVFSATACPFLTLPRSRRRDANLPALISPPAGEMIKRNPGVTVLWTTLDYRVVGDANGILFKLGDPVELAFYTEKRLATRTEILASIDSGLPILQKMADEEGQAVAASLAAAYQRALTLLPSDIHP